MPLSHHFTETAYQCHSGMSAVALDAPDEPALPMTQTCHPPCSRPALTAQPSEAPAPRPRSGIAGLPARGPWPELAVADGSGRGSYACM